MSPATDDERHRGRRANGVYVPVASGGWAASPFHSATQAMQRSSVGRPTRPGLECHVALIELLF